MLTHWHFKYIGTWFITCKRISTIRINHRYISIWIISTCNWCTISSRCFIIRADITCYRIIYISYIDVRICLYGFDRHIDRGTITGYRGAIITNLIWIGNWPCKPFEGSEGIASIRSYRQDTFTRNSICKRTHIDIILLWVIIVGPYVTRHRYSSHCTDIIIRSISAIRCNRRKNGYLLECCIAFRWIIGIANSVI